MSHFIDLWLPGILDIDDSSSWLLASWRDFVDLFPFKNVASFILLSFFYSTFSLSLSRSITMNRDFSFIIYRYYLVRSCRKAMLKYRRLFMISTMFISSAIWARASSILSIFLVFLQLHLLHLRQLGIQSSMYSYMLHHFVGSMNDPAVLELLWLSESSWILYKRDAR